MAFPASFSDGDTHLEGGKLFTAKNGRWRDRPERRTSFSELAAPAAGLVCDIPSDLSTTRIACHAAFKLSGDGLLQVNFTKSGTWMSPAQDSDLKYASGDLTTGVSSWRNADWKSLKAPIDTGFWINWPTDDWKIGNAKRGYAKIEVHLLDGEYSHMTWYVLGIKLNQHPCLSEGTCELHAAPRHLGRIAFNTSAQFEELSLFTEAY